jgi:hypothetical protein
MVKAILAFVLAAASSAVPAWRLPVIGMAVAIAFGLLPVALRTKQPRTGELR